MRVLANDTGFDTDPDTNLLTALAHHGVCARFSCRNGNCGLCEAQLNNGSVWMDDSCTCVDAPARILLCRAFARSDVELAVTPARTPVSRYCRVVRVEKITGGYDVELRLPAGRIPPLYDDDAIQLEGCTNARLLKPQVLPLDQRVLLLRLRDDDNEWLAAIGAGNVRVCLPVTQADFNAKSSAILAPRE